MLKHLRELLLKQASPELRDYVSKMDDASLSSAVVESLQKARSAGTVNAAKSAAVAHSLPLAADSHPLEGLDAALIHDALGHHLTHYKAALKAGNRELANDHLAATMQTIHHAYTMEREHKLRQDPGKESPLPIRIRSGCTASTPGEEGQHLLSPKPWEMVYSGSKRKPNGDLAEDTKLWGRRRKGMFTDHAYMEHAPNPNHADSKKAYNLYGYDDAAYPFHELQVNGHHVVIDDIDSPGEFKPHALDSHPALKHAYTTTTEWAKNPDELNSALEKEHKAWLQSPELEEWLNNQMEKDGDPLHVTRGLSPSSPILASPREHNLDPEYGKLSGKRGPQSPAKAESAIPTAPIVKPEYAADPRFKPIPDKTDEGTVAAMVHSLVSKGTKPDTISKIFRIPPEEVERLSGVHQERLDSMDEAAHTLLSAGHDPADIAKQLNIAHSSVHDFAKRHEMRQMLKDIAARKAGEEQ